MEETKDLFSIGVLATACSISPMTLRSWERRYGLLKPTRTPKGHRLYSAADVKVVKQILSYIKQGVSVGKVKALLSLTEREALAEKPYSNWSGYHDKMLEAVKTFNLNKLDSIYNEIISLYPIDIISDHLLLPLLKTYQAHISAHYKGAIAEENFFANYIRNRLAAHFQRLASVSTGPILLFAALPTERHDFLLLLFATHCMTAGYKVLSLGTNTPMDQVLFAAEEIKPASIICFGEIKNSDIKITVSEQKNIFNFKHQHNKEKFIIALGEDFTIALEILRNQLIKTS